MPSPTDGPYCALVQRRLSAPLSRRLAVRVDPGVVTAADAVVGLAAAGALAAGSEAIALITVQLFGVLSCTDGEVARLRAQVSKRGDFADTLVDRTVEVAFVCAVVVYLADDMTGRAPFAAGLALLAAVALLTLSAEKFRSATHAGYPKRRLEGGFAWVSAGSDVRLMVLSAGVLAAWATDESQVLLATVWALAAVAFANYAHRVVRVIGGRALEETTKWGGD
jgi:phosphatidylglycerophosphate synthase